MKILWISNVTFPEACQEIGVPTPAVGGWMAAGANALMRQSDDIQLAVVSLQEVKDITIIEKYKIRYYIVPNKYGNQNYNPAVETYFKSIIDDYDPDLIHIHGSEYPHSLACARVAGQIPVVVSIQGLVSIYSKYFMGGLSERTVREITNLKDRIKHSSLINLQKQMAVRGEYERELLAMVNHVIGRTSWDKSCVWAINPKVKYHFCNETLRHPFYTNQWSWDKCKKHTIFLSQGHYPIKGFHKVLEALPLVIRHYPDTKVILAGHNILNMPFYKLSGYAKYCKKMISSHHLGEVIKYVGMIDADTMAEHFCKANVFICPSSIENSPNSVGEAQLVGTPVIGSYVGGTMDMIADNETGFLYRFEEISLLAMRICQLFADKDLCERLSVRERAVARIRHDGMANAKQMLDIYNKILQ